MRKLNRSGLLLAATAVAGAFIALAGTGCAGRYGAAPWDLGVAHTFLAGQVLPGHRYYTNASETWPNAILALREDRPLRNPFWHEVAISPGTLAALVDRMRGTSDTGPHGYAVLDDRGQRIGAWFSFQPPTAVKLLDDGGVDMAPPALEPPPPLEPPPSPAHRRSGN